MIWRRSVSSKSPPLSKVSYEGDTSKCASILIHIRFGQLDQLLLAQLAADVFNVVPDMRLAVRDAVHKCNALAGCLDLLSLGYAVSCFCFM
ncbi:hypothetical protein D3C74_59750 [compost metagenome]